MLTGNFENTPVRRITAKAELYGSANATFSYTDDLVGISVDRIGESKFFGFGVSQKVNIKIRDVERKYDITTANHFKIYFNDVAPLPLFYVSEVHRDENTNQLSITGYDKLYEANAHTVSELILEEYTIGEFANACGSLLGLTTVLPEIAEFEILYSNGANFEGSETIREALDAIAEATQTMYFINHENKLVFKRLDKDGAANYTIDKSNYFTLNSKTNRRLVGICSATELGDNIEAHLEQSGTTQFVRDNPFWELRDDIADLVDNALNAMGGFTINQFNCSWRGNYLLEPGDKLELITKDNGSVFSFLISDTIDYNGSFSQSTDWEYTDSAESATNPTNLGEALKQTYAKVDKQNKQIDLVASETSANTANIASLQINTDSINASVSTLEKRMNESDGMVEELSKKVSTAITDEQLSIAIESRLSDGVSSVETSTGFTFNEEGLTISKSESEISTTITEDGMTVKKGSKNVLTADNEGVQAIDLHATTYLLIGNNSRFEDYGSNRTGCFWIGG